MDPCLGNRIVVLPHTVDAAELVNAAGDRVIWMLRDPRAYVHVLAHTAHPENVYLGDDLAFSLASRPGVLPPAGNAYGPRATAGIGDLFRTDGEKTSIRLPAKNYDLSEKGPHDPNGAPVNLAVRGYEMMNSPRYACEAATAVFNHIARYRAVYTNRLHMCISASLVGTEAYCYPNGTPKNKAIFDMSIKDKFPKSQFVNQISGEVVHRAATASAT